MKFVHLHLPKTAGTSLRESLIRAHPELTIRQIINPATETEQTDIDVISGHISYEDAIRYSDQIVTVLRHPVDRFASTYYFWRELYEKDIERTRKTSLAHALPLVDFAQAFDEPELCSELYNRMAWQLHSNFRLIRRFETRAARPFGLEILAAEALDNLRSFAVVGFQDRYDAFLSALNDRFALNVKNRKINVTARRSAVEDLTYEELSAILPWVTADMEIYTTALKEFG